MTVPYTKDEIARIVERNRRISGYKTAKDLPINPFQIASFQRIEVVKIPLSDKAAFFSWGPSRRPRVILNADQPERWVFQLAHELVHYWCHPSAQRWGSPIARFYERQANFGASILLMPAGFVREIGPNFNWNVNLMSQYFGVSYTAMLLRLKTLRLCQSTRTQHMANRRRSTSTIKAAPLVHSAQSTCQIGNRSTE